MWNVVSNLDDGRERVYDGVSIERCFLRVCAQQRRPMVFLFLFFFPKPLTCGGVVFALREFERAICGFLKCPFGLRRLWKFWAEALVKVFGLLSV